MSGHPIERLLQRFEARDWDAAAQELHEDVVVDWPHTGERIRSRKNVIELNRNWPGPWAIDLRRLVTEGEVAVAEVAVSHPGGVDYCAGFYELEDGKIRRATEYWVQGGAEEPPKWRSRWVEQT